ncbi:hypothetical protein OH76DRAFT_1409081 [Lentinus brumalis]|uniref:Uncharacterized protein n=1 Tax=Lentinus brumalis TaxID=2498619 RepID=A0A371CW50_9APHY|nr:hypothetical protein OH76DRAFT_1409081 [Polyporus brumalis]
MLYFQSPHLPHLVHFVGRGFPAWGPASSLTRPARPENCVTRAAGTPDATATASR